MGELEGRLVSAPIFFLNTIYLNTTGTQSKLGGRMGVKRRGRVGRWETVGERWERRKKSLGRTLTSRYIVGDLRRVVESGRMGGIEYPPVHPLIYGS